MAVSFDERRALQRTATAHLSLNLYPLFPAFTPIKPRGHRQESNYLTRTDFSKI
jgi:hypothetical protein